jgi:two-component system sensor histidine kinase DesK
MRGVIAVWGQQDAATAGARTWPEQPESRGGIGFSRAILITVLTAYLIVQVLNVLRSPIPSHGIALGLGLVSLGLVFALQIMHSSMVPTRWPVRRRLITLAAQAAFTYLPLLAFGREWGAMSGFLAGSLLLLVPGWTAWALYTLVVASMVVEPWLMGLGVQETAYLAIATMDVGLTVFGLTRLTIVIGQLHSTRGELAQLAVIRERMRFARDLHDLLGFSLSAITLKAELTRRLVEGNPTRARDELAEIIDVARQALADVREISGGYRNMSLAKEASSVTSLLSTAGIAVHTEIGHGALSEDVDTALATVLREAVTNIFRHSAVQHCQIRVSQSGETVQLFVANDGVPHSAKSSRHGGGLENLGIRLRAVGGRLTTRLVPGDRFELLAEAPGLGACTKAEPSCGVSTQQAERKENVDG